MEKHDKDYLLNRYFELKTRERKQMNRTLARIDRDNIRKLEKIISEKYEIPIDKLRQMWYNKDTTKERGNRNEKEKQRTR